MLNSNFATSFTIKQTLSSDGQISIDTTSQWVDTRRSVQVMQAGEYAIEFNADIGDAPAGISGMVTLRLKSNGNEIRRISIPIYGSLYTSGVIQTISYLPVNGTITIEAFATTHCTAAYYLALRYIK